MGRARRHEQAVHEPAGRRRFAVGAGHGHEPLTSRRGGIGDDLLPRLERHACRARRHQLRMIWVDRGQRLCHGQPLDPRRIRAPDRAPTQSGCPPPRARPSMETVHPGRNRSRPRQRDAPAVPRPKRRLQRRRRRGCALARVSAGPHARRQSPAYVLRGPRQAACDSRPSRSISNVSAASALSTLVAVAVIAPDVAPDVVAAFVSHGDIGQADRFLIGAARPALRLR